MAEMQLAHAVDSDVERAYRRTGSVERRRAMLVPWHDHLAGTAPAESAESNVVAFPPAAAGQA